MAAALRNARLERATGVAGRASFVPVAVKTETPPSDGDDAAGGPTAHSPRRVIGRHAAAAVKHEYADAQQPPLAIVEHVEDLQRALVPVSSAAAAADAASLASGGDAEQSGEAAALAEERMAAALRERQKRSLESAYEPLVSPPDRVHEPLRNPGASGRKPMRKRVRRRIEEQEEYFDSDQDSSSNNGRGGHNRESQASEDNDAVEDDDDEGAAAAAAAAAARPPPPLPRGGGAAALMALLAQSGALGNVEAMRKHVAHPLWAALFVTYGEPAQPARCFGCKFADLRAQALPYEAYRQLIDELPQVIKEMGIEAAIVWANNHWRDNVIGEMTAVLSEADCELYAWSGISIVWHCMDHGFIEQFRQLRAVIEAQYIRDRVSMSHTFSALPFQNALADSDVQKDDLDRLARAEAHLQRVKNADPRKSCMYHPALTLDSAQARPYIRHQRYSGRGVMHLKQ